MMPFILNVSLPTAHASDLKSATPLAAPLAGFSTLAAAAAAGGSTPDTAACSCSSLCYALSRV